MKNGIQKIGVKWVIFCKKSNKIIKISPKYYPFIKKIIIN